MKSHKIWLARQISQFHGGRLSSDSGLIALAEVDKRLRVAATLAACIDDPRRPDMISHRLDEMIGFRMCMIAAGYEDANDASRLRTDPVFKMAGGRLPCDEDLASQSTLCRLENLSDRRMLLAMGHAMIDLYCRSFRAVPSQIVLDIDDTFDAVHGEQQLRLFNAHHDEYGFQMEWLPPSQPTPQCSNIAPSKCGGAAHFPTLPQFG